MKKHFTIFFIFLTSVFLLFGCAPSETDICEVLSELSSLFPEEQKCVFYTSAERDSFKLADSKALGRLYMGKFETPGCYPRIKDFAIRLPLDDSGFEIHIIKCVNRSDREEIADMLMRRIDSVRSSEILDYAPENYEKYFIGAEVYTRGDLVFLLATPDNAEVIRKIKKLI